MVRRRAGPAWRPGYGPRPRIPAGRAPPAGQAPSRPRSWGLVDPVSHAPAAPEPRPRPDVPERLPGPRPGPVVSGNVRPPDPGPAYFPAEDCSGRSRSLRKARPPPRHTANATCDGRPCCRILRSPARHALPRIGASPIHRKVPGTAASG